MISKALLLQAKDLRLKKGLSQNFLIDDQYLNMIANAAINQLDSPFPIVEIGSGAGFLTQFLIQYAQPLIAIEVDPKMIGVLESQFGHVQNFQIIPQDVQKVDLSAHLSHKGVIVGNIPYHLTGPILFQIVGELFDETYLLRQKLFHSILMVQKEVGERLVARPGDKAYSQLTLQAQYWFDITPVTLVPKQAFYPSPAVDSMVVKLTPRERPIIQVKDLTTLSRLIKHSFVHRRKTLFNNLKIAGIRSTDQLETLFQTLQISQQARPQEISIAQFGALSDALFLSN